MSWPTASRSAIVGSPSSTPRPRSSAAPGSPSSTTTTRGWRERPRTTRPAPSPPLTSTKRQAGWPPILIEEGAEVLTVYDQNGNYGHPDHIQVHHVGIRAAELAGTARVYEATINRDHLLELMAQRAEEMAEIADAPDPEEMNLGVPAEQVTTTVDVRAFIEHKRAAMAAHASQITDESFFMVMPEEAFVAAFGQEWYIRRGSVRATVEDTLFPPP